MGFENTITDGIVSGLRSYEANTHNYIQISAAISHGSSGGAIVNAKGELIGISTLSVVDGQNLNFAIPINEVMKVYKEGGVNKDDLTAADYCYKGYMNYKDGNYDKAIEYYKKAIELDPNDKNKYLNLGAIYSSKGKYDAAIICYEKAIAIDPNFLPAKDNLKEVYASKKDDDSTLIVLKKSIINDPNNAWAYFALGRLYERKGDDYNAKLNLEKAYELKPSLRK
jgi:tetratricopeptide (TPR) repeat protein